MYDSLNKTLYNISPIEYDLLIKDGLRIDYRDNDDGNTHTLIFTLDTTTNIITLNIYNSDKDENPTTTENYILTKTLQMKKIPVEPHGGRMRRKSKKYRKYRK